MKGRRLANFALLLTAFIWGTAFVAQSVGMDYVGPFTFLWTRNFIGAAALLPVIAVMDSVKKKQGKYEKMTGAHWKVLIAGGVCCGISLCIASSFQQIGIQYTTVGNAGFISSMYMLMVPVFSIFLHKKVSGKIWFCVALAAVGMYFLSIKDGFLVSRGDALIAVCAVFFAVQILFVDYYAPKTDPVKLSCAQFVVTGILSLIPGLIFETVTVSALLSAAGPILYAGLLSSGVAYTLQVVAQKYAEPTIATLFMSLESVFSLLGGIVILSQIPDRREIFGCTLVFIAVVVSQISIKKKQ